MTIKKPMKAASAAATAASPAASGGATIADRFKLDAPVQPKGTLIGKGAVYALVAGLLALGVSGLLTYMLWKHWEFLMPA